ncbi:thiamine/thiamine pyrophosphate ABC transporter permease [Limoniibacter endophyticus]|uniref:Thiamine transport system permease protein ThiP n=1 Tax=Limoniibacter endophyticus TaxID=1565040 RepID=A0A8J3DQL6_9HYPH|nr:thiamine/thiamine pyrophosphate ABC transporter permease [Limoniibacter endophyticus]GHC77228.1 thiamine/thiamine pyrophosphate ABC transporter, permease protein [Limoniibacter endophyticus]
MTIARIRLAVNDRRVLAGWLAFFFAAFVVFGAFFGMALEIRSNVTRLEFAFDAYTRRLIGFTLWQALLSTAFSIAPAVFIARALSRHPAFFGRRLLLHLFALPISLPAIVAVLGLLGLYGRAGWLASLFPFQWPGIYGISGIVLAHAFFNIPLATRLLLEALDTVPNEQWRLVAQLGFRTGDIFRFIEWPVLRASLGGVASLVFMLCITSFTIVLTLGGGPRATTLEVAIYQALRFDFDPARAVFLTVIQIGMTISTMALLLFVGGRFDADPNAQLVQQRYQRIPPLEAVLNAALLLLALIFVGTPLLVLILDGLRADLVRLLAENAVHRAAITSLVLASLSALIAVLLSLALASHAVLRRGRGVGGWLAENGAALVLVIPPIIIGSGWFLGLRDTGLVFSVAPVMVVCVNALMAMPFAVRILRPACQLSFQRYERICRLLGITGWSRWRLVEWPALRKPLIIAFAFSMALSLGDLGVIALFGSESVQTLPYLLLARMSSYRTQDAAGLALMLGALCLVLMIIATYLQGRSDE